MARTETLAADTVWLTPKEVAKRCWVTPATVMRWIHSGQLAGVRLGHRTWRISDAALATFITSRARSGVHNGA